ncbi:hypothetical protein [Marinifilum caeruleilacunae]|uniref:DUF304 domain-containing protein n=1 Tax=Marinifilum caeruleilacunae TaxID=2499076 RepID=A0ABX1WZ79_9BACT|nr:hypothetical protein [Marinifilum caeruleilacunae]NOU61374.1 hypothetical protein [Marinifilum caeruleilacunae]
MNQMQSTIELLDNPLRKITFNSPQSSRFSRIVLQTFMILFFTIPVLSTILVAITIGEVSPAIVIFYIVFGLCGYYFLRLFLWNKYGKEMIYLDTRKITYEADYKMFKSNKVEISEEDIEVEVNPVYSNEKLATLKFKSESQNIETVVKVPIEELEILKKEIEAVYNQ